MPFGLTNSLATLQCIMNEVLAPFLRKFVMVFLDDILVYSPNLQEHLTHCHTRFSVENRMHLICVPGSQFHTYDRLMSVISQDIAQNVQKRFINFYYTHDGRHEGLYTNNDNYEDTTPSSSSTGF
jgi:hypothetical protein